MIRRNDRARFVLRCARPMALLTVGAVLLGGCGSGENEESKTSDGDVMKMFLGQGEAEPTAGFREIRTQQPANASGQTGGSGSTAMGKSASAPGADSANISSGPVARPQVSGAATPGSRSYDAARVALSRPVVLPQTLPDGTQATFSVEYEFIGDGPRSQCRYAWVIAAADGRQRAANVQLKISGALQLLSSGFSPSDGPFRGWLTEQADGGEPVALCQPVTFRQ